MGRQRYTTGARVVGVVVLALVAGVLGLGPASAAPGAAPAPVRQLLTEAHHRAGAHATGARQTLRLPDGEDAETYLFVDPRCAPGTGKARPVAGVVSSTKVKLDWVLTGTGLRKTGTVKVKKVDRDTSISLPKLRAGSYRLTLAQHGRSALVADQAFDVLPCVVVKATCRAVTFTNPAGNPAVEIVYAGHEQRQQFTLTLAPGASRTVRADYAKIDFQADAETEDGLLADLGHGTVKVKQKCKHGPALPGSQAVQTDGFASCSTQGVDAGVDLAWSVQPSVVKATYEVRDADGQVVATGTVKGGREATLSLPAGTYTYRSLANGLTQPFEDVSFSVYACVQVTPRCRAVEVTNPNAADVGVLLLTVDDEESEVAGDGDVTTLPANQTVTIPWTGSSAWVLALAQEAWDGSTPFLSLASSITDEGEPLTVQVPQNC